MIHGQSHRRHETPGGFAWKSSMPHDTIVVILRRTNSRCPARHRRRRFPHHAAISRGNPNSTWLCLSGGYGTAFRHCQTSYRWQRRQQNDRSTTIKANNNFLAAVSYRLTNGSLLVQQLRKTPKEAGTPTPKRPPNGEPNRSGIPRQL